MTEKGKINVACKQPFKVRATFSQQYIDLLSTNHLYKGQSKTVVGIKKKH